MKYRLHFSLLLLIFTFAATRAFCSEYIINIPEEKSIQTIGEIVLDVPDGLHPDSLSFSYKKSSTWGFGDIHLAIYVRQEWKDIKSFTPTTNYQSSGWIVVDPRATKIKIYTKFGATLTKYIKDILVTKYEGEVSDFLPQEINWEQTLHNLVLGSKTKLTAVATSGLPVIYESSDTAVCKIEGDILIANKIGNAKVTATQPGDDIYLPAQSIVMYVGVGLTNDIEINYDKESMPIIAPNPAKEFIRISGKNISHITIFDIQGKKVTDMMCNGENEVTIPTYQLPEGLYIVKVTDGKMAHLLKFIRQ